MKTNWRLFVTTLVIVTMGSAGLAQDAPAPHAPILIDGDSQWTRPNGVVAGTGTPEDPYLLSGWIIAGTGSPAIEVRNTSAHAVIEFNRVVASILSPGSLPLPQVGIWLKNVTNLQVRENEFHTNVVLAIRGDRIENVAISENVIDTAIPGTLVNSRRGIDVRESSNMSIRGNQFRNLDVPLRILHTTSFTIEDNLIAGSLHDHAINVDTSKSGVVVNNIAENCRGGIALSQSQHVVVMDNRVSACGQGLYAQWYGMTFGTNLVERNHFEDVDIAVWFQGCSGCVFRQNKISDATTGVFLDENVVVEHNEVANSEIALAYLAIVPSALRNNTLVGNEIHIQAPYAHLDARYNWYGTSHGPAEGTIKGHVTFEPWLTEAP